VLCVIASEIIGHTFGGVLSDVWVCLIVCDLETSKIRLPKPDLICCTTEKENIFLFLDFK